MNLNGYSMQCPAMCMIGVETIITRANRLHGWRRVRAFQLKPPWHFCFSVPYINNNQTYEKFHEGRVQPMEYVWRELRLKLTFLEAEHVQERSEVIPGRKAAGYYARFSNIVRPIFSILQKSRERLAIRTQTFY